MPEGGHRRWVAVPGHSLFLLKAVRTKEENNWLRCYIHDCHIFSWSDSEKRTAEEDSAPSFCHAWYEHANSLVMHVMLMSARKGKIVLTERFAEQWAGGEIHWLPWKVCMQKASVCEGKQRLACVIMSPGWWGHTAPAANPRIHSGWNSNHPKRSSMEFHRARGRQINHRETQAVNHQHSHKGRTGKDSNKRGWGRGWLIACENNSCLSPRLFGPLRTLWQFVRHSTLPKMAAPLGYSCWESRAHATLPVHSAQLPWYLKKVQSVEVSAWGRLTASSRQQILNVLIGWNKLWDNRHPAGLLQLHCVTGASHNLLCHTVRYPFYLPLKMQKIKGLATVLLVFIFLQRPDREG